MPALHTQLALFWGQREGMGGGRLSRELGARRLEPAGARAPGRLTGAAPKACDLQLQLASLHLVGKSFLGRWDGQPQEEAR